VARYEEVFSKALIDDILSQQAPFFVRDASIMLSASGQVWAWVDEGGRLLLSSVSVRWPALADLPCDDRLAESIPDFVWGTWVLRSVRPGLTETIRSFPWKDWKHFTIVLDPKSMTLTTTLGGKQKSCDLRGYSRDTTPDPPESTLCTAFESFWGPHAHERSYLLDAECPRGDLLFTPVAGAAVVPPLILLDNGIMVVGLGCEGIAILEKREGTAASPSSRTVPRGAPCGGANVDCPDRFLCVAVSSHPWAERSEPDDYRPSE